MRKGSRFVCQLEWNQVECQPADFKAVDDDETNLFGLNGIGWHLKIVGRDGAEDVPFPVKPVRNGDDNRWINQCC